MQIALMIEGQEDVTWEDWVAIAKACERSGVGTLFRSDHYYSVEDRYLSTKMRHPSVEFSEQPPLSRAC